MNQPAPGQSALGPGEYKKLADLLEQWTGIRLQGKVHMMSGRLARRLRETGVDSYRNYYTFLCEQGKASKEGQYFVNALTTNKTSFFREPHHFDFLVSTVFAEATARAGGPRRLRLYSAGCSRGAEPYTMAMLAAQYLPASLGWDVKILATDLDTDVLAMAKKGEYPEDEAEEVPVLLRKRWMAKRAGGLCKVHPEAASLVTFAQANLIDKPFPVRGVFEAVFCRNVMIYFTGETQQGLVDNLLGLIGPRGYFMIGHSESLMRTDVTREPVPGIYRIARDIASQQAPRFAKPAPKRAQPPPRAVQRSPRRSTAEAQHGPERRIVLGEWAVSQAPLQVSTLLGSCVAACLYDPVARVGGMNHFMLPQTSSSDGNPARFGLHAMELLVNGLLKLGAQRSRLVAKAFGAGAVNRNLTSTVAHQNETFVRQFLETEGIPLLAERLGGVDPREVFFRTDTGEARVRVVRSDARLDSLRKTEAAAVTRKQSPASPVFNAEDVLF